MVQGAIAPSILSFEIMDVLIQTEMRRRITSAQTSAQLSLVGSWPIDIVSDPSSASFSAIVPVAQAHSLTSDETAYLELAKREGRPRATTDKAMGRAASKVAWSLGWVFEWFGLWVTVFCLASLALLICLTLMQPLAYELSAQSAPDSRS